MMKIPKGSTTEERLRRKLKRKIDKNYNSMSEFAHEHKISVQTVSAFLGGTQTAGNQIPKLFGYKPALIYIPEDAEPINRTRT